MHSGARRCNCPYVRSQPWRAADRNSRDCGASEGAWLDPICGGNREGVARFRPAPRRSNDSSGASERGRGMVIKLQSAGEAPAARRPFLQPRIWRRGRRAAGICRVAIPKTAPNGRRGLKKRRVFFRQRTKIPSSGRNPGTLRRIRLGEPGCHRLMRSCDETSRRRSIGVQRRCHTHTELLW